MIVVQTNLAATITVRQMNYLYPVFAHDGYGIVCVYWYSHIESGIGVFSTSE
jgi:hypothetical protein